MPYTKEDARNRLEELRQALQSEDISGYELAELHDLRDYIDLDDVELLQAAGVPEFHDDCEPDNKCHECRSLINVAF